MACPVWNTGPTQEDTRTIERVQRTAVAIVLGDLRTTYEKGLEQLELERLEIRREALELNCHPNLLKQEPTVTVTRPYPT